MTNYMFDHVHFNKFNMSIVVNRLEFGNPECLASMMFNRTKISGGSNKTLATNIVNGH